VKPEAAGADSRPSPTSPPTQDTLSSNLNGRFVGGYDDQKAQPEDAEAAQIARHKLPGDSVPTSSLQQMHTGSSNPLTDRHGAELILDVNNLLPFDFLRSGDRLGRAVVLIRRTDGCSGTGFLVASHILLTNHHVLPDPETAASTRVSANFEIHPPDDPAGVPVDVPLDPTGLFVTNADLDFTFCAVHGLEHLGVVPLNRNSLNVLRSEPVNIIQHPRGGPKQVALQDNKVIRADNVIVQYTCDTEPGSSGSPVFNNQWALVALHHASVPTESSEGRPSPDADPRARFLNEGIRLSAIAAWLETVEPHTPEQQQAILRLRSIYRGLDPQVGFFGMLGRRRRGRTDAEVIVESYRASGEDLDLAYWDFTSSARVPSDHIHELGRIVALMGQDVWCLAGIQAAEALALCEHLNTEFRLDYVVVVEPIGNGPGLAVLHRKSRNLTVERMPWPEDRFAPFSPPPPRLLLRSRSRGSRTTSVGLVPIAPDTSPDLIGKVLHALACDIGRCEAADDWVLLGHLTTTVPLGRHAPSSCPASGRAGRARVVAEGYDGAFVLVSGVQTRVDRVFTSPNLEPTTSYPGYVSVATDRVLPTLPGVWHDPVALRLVLSQTNRSTPVSPAIANLPELVLVSPEPTGPLPCQAQSADEPATTLKTTETTATAPTSSTPSPLSVIEVQLEQALREILRPILNRLVTEIVQQPSQEATPESS
jgi:hypothetical protein